MIDKLNLRLYNMSFHKVYKDRNYDHVSKNLVDKIPRYQSTSSVGSEPGMEGNIILSRDTGKLCYHDGQDWNCIPTSASCVNAIYQGTTGVVENTYVNITNGTDDTVGFIGPTDANWEWAVRAGGVQAGVGFGITSDKCGNSYVTGYFNGSIGFYNRGANTPSITLDAGDSPPTGVLDIFVGKINNAGEWQWAVKAGGAGTDTGISISVDGYGNAYVTGYFSDTAGFYNTEALAAEIILVSGASPPTGGGDAFVAKINSAGYWEWAVKAGGLSVDQGFGISSTKCGTSYVTGFFRDTVGFYNNGADAANITLTSIGLMDIFLARIDSSGYWSWAAKAGGSSIDIGRSVSVDDCENAYITGFFTSQAEFYNSGSVIPQFILTSSTANNAFVAKINPDGIWNWGAVIQGQISGQGLGISVSKDSIAYVTGFVDGDTGFYNVGSNVPAITVSQLLVNNTFIAQINGSGYWQWAAIVRSGLQTNKGASIIVDECGDAHICGYYRDHADFYNNGSVVSKLSLPGFGNVDDNIYTAKINASGEWIWALRAGSADYEGGNGVTVDNCGNTYVTGFYENNTIGFYNNGAETADITLESLGSNIFVAKINGFLCSKKPIATVSQTVSSAGDMSQVCFTNRLVDHSGIVPGTYYKINSAGQLEETCCEEADFAGVSDSQIISV